MTQGFNWTAVTSPTDLEVYQKRVIYLEGQLEHYNKQYQETGKVDIDEDSYMRIAAELLYYRPESPYLTYLDSQKLMSNSLFFPEVRNG